MSSTKNKQVGGGKSGVGKAKKVGKQGKLVQSAPQTLSLRPSKKQTEVMVYIQQFIDQHGYGPSYREIMRGLNYTSVATVAAHINALTAMGHLLKKGRSARSLYILKPIKNAESLSLSSPVTSAPEPSGAVKSHEKWLVGLASDLLTQAEASLDEDQYYNCQMVIESLKILGMDAAALSLNHRLKQLEEKLDELG